MDDKDIQPVIQPQQVCSIRIGFQVDTDEQAVEYKKKISAVLSDVPNAQIQFSLMTIPVK